MNQEWSIDSPRVLDVGGADEQVRILSVAVVGGHVDVVTHTDSPTARVEVSAIEGRPLKVVWDGVKLKITHGVDKQRILDRVREAFDGLERNKVTLSISVPEQTATTLSTVNASGLLAGLRSGAKANTVSGSITVDDVRGEVDVNTVSGEIEGVRLDGPLKINSISGAVTVQGSDLPSVGVHTVSGDITLDLVNGRTSISSQSVSADVTVRAPHQGYDVVANTASGHVVIDGRTIDRFSRLPGNRLTDGDGALRLKANAVSGNVVVLQAAGGEG